MFKFSGLKDTVGIWIAPVGADRDGRLRMITTSGFPIALCAERVLPSYCGGQNDPMGLFSLMRRWENKLEGLDELLRTVLK